MYKFSQATTIILFIGSQLPLRKGTKQNIVIISHVITKTPHYWPNKVGREIDQSRAMEGIVSKKFYIQNFLFIKKNFKKTKQRQSYRVHL